MAGERNFESQESSRRRRSVFAEGLRISESQIGDSSEPEEISELSTARGPQADEMESFDQDQCSGDIILRANDSEENFLAAGSSYLTSHAKRYEKHRRRGRRSRTEAQMQIEKHGQEYLAGNKDVNYPPYRRRRSLEDCRTVQMFQALRVTDDEPCQPTLQRSDSWPPRKGSQPEIHEKVEIPEKWKGDFELGEWAKSGTIEKSLQPEGLMAARQALLESHSKFSNRLLKTKNLAVPGKILFPKP